MELVNCSHCSDIAHGVSLTFARGGGPLVAQLGRLEQVLRPLLAGTLAVVGGKLVF